MPKNFQDYLGNKVTFLKRKDNGLLLGNVIEFFAGFLCGITVTNLENQNNQMIRMIINDINLR